MKTKKPKTTTSEATNPPRVESKITGRRYVRARMVEGGLTRGATRATVTFKPGTPDDETRH